MITVEVEGVGRLEFPDGTDEAVIQRTVKQVIGGRAGPAKPEGPAEGYFSDLTREATAGTTLGAGDYVGAASAPAYKGVMALLDPDTEYSLDQAVKDYRGRLDQISKDRGRFADENPVMSTVAQGVGGMAAAPMQIAGRTTAAIPGAIEMVRRVLPRTPRTAAAVGLGTSGAAAGATTGALEARPESPEAPLFGQHNVEGAKTGGAIGGVLGLALPGAGKLVMWLGSKSVGPLARRWAERVLESGPQGAAERKLLERIEADQMTPQRLEARLERLGPEATIADAGGENVAGLAEDLANQPGVARNMANRVLEGRASGQSRRIAASAQETMQVEGDFHGRLDALRRQRSARARPLYEQAFERTDDSPISSEWLQRATADPVIRRGMARGLDIQRIEALADDVPFRPMDDVVTGVDEAGEAIIEGVPTLRLWDAAKRGLDQIVFEVRAGQMPGIKDPGEYVRAVNGLRRRLVRELDDQTGGAEGAYARARAEWAGPSQAMDYMQFGRRFLRGDPEQVAMSVADMSPQQREFFREGVFQELQAQLASKGEHLNQTKRWLRTPKVREALRAAYGPGKEGRRGYRTLMRDLLRESRFSDVRNTVTTGSPTQRRQAGAADLGVDPGMAVDALTGNNVGVVSSVLRRIFAGLTDMPAAQKGRLAQMLLSQDRDAQLVALRALNQRAQVGQFDTRMVRELTDALGPGAATASAAGQGQ